MYWQNTTRNLLDKMYLFCEKLCSVRRWNSISTSTTKCSYAETTEKYFDVVRPNLWPRPVMTCIQGPVVKCCVCITVRLEVVPSDVGRSSCRLLMLLCDTARHLAQLKHDRQHYTPALNIVVGGASLFRDSSIC